LEERCDSAAGAAVTGALGIERAIEVFVRAFCITRSFTHPYVAKRIEGVWVVRDEPRKKGDYRNEEWIGHGIDPKQMDRIARRHTRGRFAVCAIHGMGEPDGPLRAGYKALGYRLGTTEPLMVHNLRKIPQMESIAQIERVKTMELAERLAKAAQRRQVLEEHLRDDSKLRQYVANIDGQIVGWVRSIAVEKATWCSNMYVRPEFRRRGIARAMLCRMLREDREQGAKAAVLLASHTGAKLYAAVAYDQIGTLLLFTPRRKDAPK